MNKMLNRRRFLDNTVAVITATVVFPYTESLFATSEVTEHRIEIANFVFSTGVLIVKPGDKVTWTNNDIVPHTATAKDRAWDTGLIEPGESATIVVNADMTESYFCEYHPSMIAEFNIVT